MRFLVNVNVDDDDIKLSAKMNDLGGRPTTEVLEKLRVLERKMSVAWTLLRASVYSIVLQGEIHSDGDDNKDRG